MPLAWLLATAAPWAWTLLGLFPHSQHKEGYEQQLKQTSWNTQALPPRGPGPHPNPGLLS